MEAGSVPAAAPEAAPAGEGAPEGQQFDPEAAFSSLRGNLEQLHQDVRALAPTPAEPEPEPEPEMDMSWLTELDNELVDPEARAQAQQRMAQTLQAEVDRRVQAAVQPLEARQVENERRQAAAAFVSDFPEFAEEGGMAKAEEAVHLAGAIAQREVAHINPQLAGELASSPWFWSLAYRASRAPVPGQGAESPGGGAAAHLEGGGGPRPPAPEVDPGDQIVSQEERVLPF